MIIVFSFVSEGVDAKVSVSVLVTVENYVILRKQAVVHHSQVCPWP